VNRSRQNARTFPPKFAHFLQKNAHVPAKKCALSRHILEFLGIAKEVGKVPGEILPIFRNVETSE
jgi:hypothetical protein